MKLTFDRKHLLAAIDILVEPHTRAYADAWARGGADATVAWAGMETYIQAAYRLMEQFRCPNRKEARHVHAVAAPQHAQ